MGWTAILSKRNHDPVTFKHLAELCLDKPEQSDVNTANLEKKVSPKQNEFSPQSRKQTTSHKQKRSSTQSHKSKDKSSKKRLKQIKAHEGVSQSV